MQVSLRTIEADSSYIWLAWPQMFILAKHSRQAGSLSANEMSSKDKCVNMMTNVCMCSYTRPHTSMHIRTHEMIAANLESVFVHTQTLMLKKTEVAGLSHLLFQSCNQLPESVPALWGFSATNVRCCCSLLWFIPLQLSTCTHSQHFTFC